MDLLPALPGEFKTNTEVDMRLMMALVMVGIMFGAGAVSLTLFLFQTGLIG